MSEDTPWKLIDDVLYVKGHVENIRKAQSIAFNHNHNHHLRMD